MTRAGSSGPIGTGYDPKLGKASSLYSYGATTSRYVPSMDPDKEKHCRSFWRRAIILKIN